MKSVFLYSIGLLVGILGVLGWLNTLEFIVWVSLSIFAALLISGEAKRPILTAFGLGFSWAIGDATLKSLFFSSFLENNPEYLASLEALPEFIDIQWVPLLTSPLIGLVLSVIIGISLGLMNRFK